MREVPGVSPKPKTWAGDWSGALSPPNNVPLGCPASQRSLVPGTVSAIVTACSDPGRVAGPIKATRAANKNFKIIARRLRGKTAGGTK